MHIILFVKRDHLEQTKILSFWYQIVAQQRIEWNLISHLVPKISEDTAGNTFSMGHVNFTCIKQLLTFCAKWSLFSNPVNHMQLRTIKIILHH